MTRGLSFARAALLVLLLPLALLPARLTPRKKPRPPVAADGARVDYARDVRPILEARCYRCHAGKRRKGGLRLDGPEHIRQGGHSGQVVVPHHPEHSLLVDALTGANEAPRMPPVGRPLRPREIALLRAWIAAGAPMPGRPAPHSPAPPAHWAFRPPVAAAAPAPPGDGWARGPLDAFLAHKHAELHLTPSPPAAPERLLRRVYLDLVGLPPTREQTRAFLRDPSPTAYEKVVERLLASPRHGERWGRHWMDVWRYSDPDGRKQQNDVWWSNPYVWRWRDWIVSSLNAGVGYDRMVTEMLAGDELAPNDPEALAATGFLVRGWFKHNRNIWLHGAVEHTSKAFLGVTVGCARCHDHKTDPLAQRDFYALRAFFEPIDFRVDPLPPAPVRRGGALARALDLYHDSPTHVYVRGDERRPLKDESIAPQLPRVLGGPVHITPVPHSTGRRLALARAIVAPTNPLAARVAVNHVWLRHMGAPLVENVADFGTLSPAPRHQALLDWLAVGLMRHDWDLKWLHRTIVTSAAYRMQSAVTSATVTNLRGDADNRWLWRFESRRLEGEALRDGLLHLAGALDATMGGPPLNSAADAAPGRRSLYYRYSREDKLALLAAFDAASVDECYRRQTSVVPQQALALTTSELVWGLARRLAGRLGEGTPAAFTTRAFEHVLGRAPTPAERAACVEYLAAQAGRRSPGVGEEAAWRRARERLVHALLNHNDFLTVR